MKVLTKFDSTWEVSHKAIQACCAHVFQIALVLLMIPWLSSQADAGLVSADDPVFGLDSLTIDDATNLAWLDVTFTDARAFQDVSLEFGVMGDFEGFRYATEEEVLAFFSNAGIPDLPSAGTLGDPSSTDNFTPISELLDLVGTTDNANTFALGITSTPSNFFGGGHQVTAFALLSGSNGQVGLSATQPSTINGASGSWLVKSTTITVGIDIKPGSFPNSINLSSGGATPVAILGDGILDLMNIDLDTLTFGSNGIKTVGRKDHQLCSFEDVSGDFVTMGLEGFPDGELDLVCHFVTYNIVPELGDTQVKISGDFMSGGSFEGSDSVNIVP